MRFNTASATWTNIEVVSNTSCDDPRLLQASPTPTTEDVSHDPIVFDSTGSSLGENGNLDLEALLEGLGKKIGQLWHERRTHQEG